MLIERRPGTGIVLCAVLLAGAAMTARAQESFAAEAQEDAPRIEVVESVVDLGAVPKGEPAEASYRILNTGGTTLRIHKAKPG